jgi:hypothetical protein
LSLCRLLAARVFELPAVSKDAEHDPLETINVVQHTGKAALEMALKHYSHLFIQQQSETRSSKAAVRLPALSACKPTPGTAELLARIQHINALKAPSRRSSPSIPACPTARLSGCTAICRDDYPQRLSHANAPSRPEHHPLRLGQ